MASGKSIKWLAALLVAANLVIVAVVLLGPGRAKPKPVQISNPTGTNTVHGPGDSPR